MFLLDTNILSAMMSAEPAREVAVFVSGKPSDLLFTAAICQAEIFAGLAIMPPGRRRHNLEVASHGMFSSDFGERILPFDSGAAFAYSEIFEIRRRAGRPAATLDLMIAAIARFRSCILVTRNESDFELCGIEIINPWRSL